MAVLLGALLADVPHSRPVSVTAHATDPGLIQRLALQPPTYEGPTGIVGVLHQAFADSGLPAASLWAAVPHYVAVAPNPKGALALLRRLESLVGVTVDATDLEDAANEYEQQVSRAVELDPDVQAFVERLERAADEESGRPDPGSLPSGDVLAREFQRFLRQRGEHSSLTAPSEVGARQSSSLPCCRPRAAHPWGALTRQLDRITRVDRDDEQVRPRASRARRRTALSSFRPCTRRPTTNAHAQPPDTRSGSRTSSTPTTTASARSPATWIPSATVYTVSVIQSRSSSQRSTGTFSSSST